MVVLIVNVGFLEFQLTVKIATRLLCVLTWCIGELILKTIERFTRKSLRSSAGSLMTASKTWA